MELPLDEVGRIRLDALEAALARDAASVALVTQLWANNEVGTIQPVDEIARAHRAGRRARCTSTRSPRTGSCRSTSAASASDGCRAGAGLVALSVSAHKIGGPVGIGALVLDRSATVEPLIHGGGTAAPGALRHAGRRGGRVVRGGRHRGARAGSTRTPRRMSALRDRLIAGALAARARGAGCGRPRSRGPAARQRALHLPRLRGRLAAVPARRRRASRCRPGRRARPACPSRRTCCWRWA